MTKKSPIIKQSKVTELITELASLSKRKKEPDDPVSLSEIFRTKEYAAEVRAALKKGYTFESLAELFTNRCGVAVSARQIKYHLTRGKNQGMKSKSRAKAVEIGVTGSRVSSAVSPGKDAAEGVKENFMPSDSSAKDFPKGGGFFSGSGTATDAKPGAFSFNSKPKES